MLLLLLPPSLFHSLLICSLLHNFPTSQPCTPPSVEGTSPKQGEHNSAGTKPGPKTLAVSQDLCFCKQLPSKQHFLRVLFSKVAPRYRFQSLYLMLQLIRGIELEKKKSLLTSSSFAGRFSKVHKHNIMQNVVYISQRVFCLGFASFLYWTKLCAPWPFACLCVMMLWCDWIPIHR